VCRAVAEIAADHPAAARHLRQEVDNAARVLGPWPALGCRHPALLGNRYRLWPLPGFAFVLVYDAASEPARIVRCVDAARDLPGILTNLTP
jgi:toxin ParE1/3/4